MKGGGMNGEGERVRGLKNKELVCMPHTETASSPLRSALKMLPLSRPLT